MMILMSVRWQLIVILIFISLTIKNVEYLCMWLLDIYMSSLEKCLFLPIFLDWVVCLFVFCYWVVWAVCIFWKLNPCSSHHLKIFSKFSLHFVCGFFCCVITYEFDCNLSNLYHKMEFFKGTSKWNLVYMHVLWTIKH